MAIASTLFSPKSLMDRFRSPVFIASALSLGAHGVFFAAMPMLSAGEDLQDQEESVPVVALSPEEAQRLPDAVRNSGSSAFLGDNPFVTQEGDSLLPVPGIPPYGDLTGLNSGFDDPLQTAPLWDSPIDIFQGSLPAIPSKTPGETTVIFPDSGSSGNGPVSLFPGGGVSFDNSNVAPNNPAPSPGGAAEGGVQGQTNSPIAPEDEPIVSSTDAVPGSGLEAPLVASTEGTTVGNAFGGESAPSEPVNSDSLASETSATGEETAPVQGPSSSGPSMAGNDPALLALQAEQKRLSQGYRNNGTGAADPGQVAADLGQLGSDQALALQPALSPLVVQYPDPAFKCPADSLPALFTLVTQKDGSILSPQLVQSTQYAALDTAAQAAAATFAAELTNPGIYQLIVTFKDETGRCAQGDVNA